MSTDDRHYMQLALAEARKGQGRTSPNPCVGAVVVRDSVVVGKGYHKKAGTPHAEVHALADADEAARGATVYVTLEPCNHIGRTPPCSQALLAAGVSRVVIGLMDPNPVAMGGAEFLAAHGVEVRTGVCEDECRELNYPFIKHITTGLPWVVMKAGMSLDARISYQRGSGGAVTSKESGLLVHQLRDRLDGILIGSGTAAIDNPSLTTRLEKEQGRDPVRIIIDSRLSLSPNSRMLQQNSTAPTWIFCVEDASSLKEEQLVEAGAVIYRVGRNREGRVDLRQVLSLLGGNNITSLLVEGGAAIHGSFLRENLVDEVYLFIAPFFIGEDGTPLLSGFSVDGRDSVHFLSRMSTRQAGSDFLVHGLFSSPGKDA